jgi:hypothetical protein
MKLLFSICARLALTSLIVLQAIPNASIAQDSSPAKAESVSSLNNPVWYPTPATPEGSNKKIEEAAQQSNNEEGVPVSNLYNIAYPEDRPSYEALNGHALLLLTAISHKKEELPLKSVYVQQDATRTELQRIAMVLSDQSNSENISVKVFGAYRMDAVYALPIQLRMKTGTLTVDFAQNYSGVKVATFGSPLPKGVAELVSNPLKNQTIPPLSVLEAFMEDEFPTLTKGMFIDFSTRFTQCINHWVAFPRKPTDTKYSYGFIYLDEQAGFTYQVGSYFKIEGSNRFIKLPDEDFEKRMNLKVRIEGNRYAAILPPKALAQIGLPEKPDWLKSYDDGKNTPYHRMRLGFWLNDLGDSKQALQVLESAYKDDPTTERLELELAYAYNALKQFDKSIAVLSTALKSKPKEALLGNELAYANLHKGNYKEAIELYLQYIPLYPDGHMVEKSEMALNLAQAYGGTGNSKEQQQWLEKAKAWAPEGSAVSNYFKQQR